MDITWLGHSCFKLKGKQMVIVTDTFDPSMVGLPLAKQQTDVVTYSHGHPDHFYPDAVKPRGDKDVFVINGPGEYEMAGVFIVGWGVFHDTKKGAERGKNTIYKIVIDGINVVHLGDLGHDLSDTLVEEIGNIDVLLVPVGGEYTIDHTTAAQLASKLEPRIVVPMHYNMAGLDAETFGKLDGVEKFLKEMGTDKVDAQAKLTVTPGALPDMMQVVVLEKA